MFDNLSQRLITTIKNLRGQGRLTESNIQDALRDVRTALLEADVALPVVREFVERARARALGQEVIATLTPGQALIRVVRDELVHLMGPADTALNLNAKPPVVMLVAGLQGSGKTTSVAKLAQRLMEREKKSVAVVSCDVYRPAAIEQLRILAEEVGCHFFTSQVGEDPVQIGKQALAHARTQFVDILIIDTAGRLHIDPEMMDEVQRLQAAVQPTETLFVVDSMMGQDAVNAAKAFNQSIELTGIVLTKADGDARGGAALSVRFVTGKPIKFMGVGEKTNALEPFHPDRIVSRILGMGDVLGLIEEVEQKIDRDKAVELTKKLTKGKGFTLEDFRDQLRQMQQMGGLGSFISKLPGIAEVPRGLMEQVNDREMVKLAAIIDSMTPQERRFPAIIKASRKRRLAGGSGVQIQDVNRLLKQFSQAQKMMKRMSGKGKLARMLRGLGGRTPPGLPF
ncbi:MAG: signal recognition particle protein [Gammaproteobacteria bacterium]